MGQDTTKRWPLSVEDYKRLVDRYEAIVNGRRLQHLAYEKGTDTIIAETNGALEGFYSYHMVDRWSDTFLKDYDGLRKTDDSTPRLTKVWKNIPRDIFEELRHREIVNSMTQCASDGMSIVLFDNNPYEMRVGYAEALHTLADAFLCDDQLENMGGIYKNSVDKTPATEFGIGYDREAFSAFLSVLVRNASWDGAYTKMMTRALDKIEKLEHEQTED